MNNKGKFNNAFAGHIAVGGAGIPTSWCGVFKDCLGFDQSMIDSIEHVSVMSLQLGATGTNSDMDKRNFKTLYGYDFGIIMEELQSGSGVLTSVSPSMYQSVEENREKFYMNFSKARLVPGKVKENSDGYTFMISFTATYDESIRSMYKEKSLVRMIPDRPFVVEISITLKPEAPAEEKAPEEGAQA